MGEEATVVRLWSYGAIRPIFIINMNEAVKSVVLRNELCSIHKAGSHGQMGIKLL